MLEGGPQRRPRSCSSGERSGGLLPPDPPGVRSSPRAARDGLAWSPTFGIESGQPAHIDAPGLVAWAIPSSRQEFDLYRLVADLADDDALEIAFAVTDWVAVADRQVVRVSQIDGGAAEVEVLDGVYAGRRGGGSPPPQVTRECDRTAPPPKTGGW